MAPSVGTLATHMFGTLFTFSIEARDDLLKLFDVAVGTGVSCQVEDDYFVLRCPSDDLTSLPACTQILQDFIQNEQGRKLDLFDDARLIRVRGTFTIQGVELPLEKPTQTMSTAVGVSDDAAPMEEGSSIEVHQTVIGNTEKSLIRHDDNTFLIDHETFVQSWSSKMKGGLIDSSLRDQVLGRIGSLCQCRLEFSDTEINIKSGSQNNIDRAIAKLNVLNGAIHSRGTLPHIFSFPVLESHLGAILQLIPLGELKDQRLKTTLVSPESSLFRNLRSALVLATTREGIPILVKPANKSADQTAISLWESFPHHPFGAQVLLLDQPSGGQVQPEPPPMEQRVQSIPAEKLATPTGKWLQQNPAEYEDPFMSTSATYQQEEAILDQPVLGPIAEPIRPPTKRARAPRGASKAVPLNQVSTMEQEVEPPNNVQVVPGSSVRVSLSDPEPAVVTNRRLASNKDNKQPTQNAPPYVPLPSSTSNENRQPPRIEPPYMPPPNSVSAHHNPNNSWEGKIVRGATEGLLIDVEESKPPATKDLKRTMRQQKPRPLLTGSKTEMVKRFEKGAIHLLNLALPQPGPFRLELDFGKMLIDPRTCTAESRQPFAPSEWQRVFPAKTGASAVPRETVFTHRLTTQLPDIDSVLKLQLSQGGRKLFVEEPRERKVTYTIFCVTKTNVEVVIEVHEDGSFMMKGSEFLIGALDWYFPLRSWDARLKLEAQEPLLLDYHKQAQAIVDHMKITIPEDEKTIQFSTTCMDQELIIQSVLLQRETIHSATVYPDLQLHLKEIQDMSVQQVPASQNRYQGLIHIPRKMISTGSLWWQASVTSINASTILKESENLEFGESGAGKWSPESIIDKGVIEDMYSLASDIVTNIDHVGSKNYRPIGSSDPKTGSRTEGEQSRQINYW